MSSTSATFAEPFCHEALLYAGEEEFLRATERFILDGLQAGEPTLVVVGAAKIDALRAALPPCEDTVMFADMADVGANPGRIIPAWQEFVARYGSAGVRLRGIGEPVWTERGAAELVECQRHESLLNLAFADAAGFKLLCPYDVLSLGPAVLEEAERSHPIVRDGRTRRRSTTYADIDPGSTLDAPLPEAPVDAREARFGPASLGSLRALVGREAARAGLLSGKIADMVLAVNEVATNSITHGGGSGRLRIWRESAALVCEVSDRGQVDSALVDRRRPDAQPDDSRGLWMANQLCDLVQLRSSSSGTTVRVHVVVA
ncbi:MAG: sensor histidine kinase [Candidatus Dormibacter sp.]